MANAKLPPLSEAAFLKQILALAKHCRWRTAHFRPAQVKCRRCDGRGWTQPQVECRVCKGTGMDWRTAVQGDGKGFPDLVLVKGKRLIIAELKRESQWLSAEQNAWFEALEIAGQRCYVWWPSDWDEIVRILSAAGSDE